MADLTMHERFAYIVRSISYKPNWEVDAVLESGHSMLRLSFVTSNSNKPEDPTPIKIGRVRVVPVEMSYLWENDPARFDTYAVHWVRRQIIDLELHEIDEWLRLEGERTTAPQHHGVA